MVLLAEPVQALVTTFPASGVPGRLGGRASAHVHQLGSLAVPGLGSLPGVGGAEGRSEVPPQPSRRRR